MALTREQRRQQWNDKTSEAYDLINRVKATLALYLAEPWPETEKAARAIQDAYMDLARAQAKLEIAYRAEATVQPPEEVD